MLNGEEAVIGGLFVNEESVVRTGIPVLKDLPWWFFGLRYIFGSDQKITRKKELVILLEVELVPTLKERVSATSSGNLLKNEVEKQNKRLKLYEFNQQKYDK
jgi:type IV pilus assembly protein PilQ